VVCPGALAFGWKPGQTVFYVIMQKLPLGRTSAENRVEISRLRPVAIRQLIVDQTYFPASPSWSTGCELFESARAAFSFFNDHHVL
jgi:hypothetical protein